MNPLSYEVVSACLRLRVPVTDFLRNDQAIITEEVQTKLLSDLREIAAFNAFYVKLFLSRYIKILESCTEVTEELYELYCDPAILNSLELPPAASDRLLYVVDDRGTLVEIVETPKIISGAGTTGLRTWEAALYLLNYLNNSCISLKGKSIAELGTGTGLVSLALLKNKQRHQLGKVVLTDGDLALVEKLRDTLQLNGVLDEDVATQTLVWGTTRRNGNAFCQDPPLADIVVAADVTYDALVVPQLCETIADFLAQGTQMAIIAATVRNVATVEVWEQELTARFLWGLLHREADPHLCTLPWFKAGTPEIRIYRIEKQSRSS